VGLSSGLFVATAAEAHERDPKISSMAVLVLVAGVVLGGLFYAGLAVQRRNGWAYDDDAPGWLYALYASVWVLGVAAAVYALFSEGGFKVAALAIVPLVLLAPPAFQGIRLALHRAPP
jgi:heme/copper-type cytochrome/quinol oxidase subunit 2